MSASIGVLGCRGSEHAQLFRKWEKLLHFMVRQNMSRLRLWFEYDDLLNHARLGLWKAHNTYDSNDESGANFQTYARRVITNAFNALHHYSLASMRRDRVKSDSMDEMEETGDHLPCHASLSDSILISDEEVMVVNAALSRLPPRERHVVVGRLFHEKTLEAVGQEMGVTRERIRQIESKTLVKLFFDLRPHFPDHGRRGRVRKPILKIPRGDG
jgi:RNA polymerase sigma factor (sigma-70 family)